MILLDPPIIALDWSDDFSDGVVDSRFVVFGAGSVVETGGILRLSTPGVSGIAVYFPAHRKFTCDITLSAINFPATLLGWSRFEFAFGDAENQNTDGLQVVTDNAHVNPFFRTNIKRGGVTTTAEHGDATIPLTLRYERDGADTSFSLMVGGVPTLLWSASDFPDIAVVGGFLAATAAPSTASADLDDFLYSPTFEILQASTLLFSLHKTSSITLIGEGFGAGLSASIDGVDCGISFESETRIVIALPERNSPEKESLLLGYEVAGIGTPETIPIYYSSLLGAYLWWMLPDFLTHYPMEISASGDLALTPDGLTCLMQDAADILDTVQGDIPDHPDIGAGLNQFLGESSQGQPKARLARQIAASLNRHGLTPRIVPGKTSVVVTSLARDSLSVTVSAVAIDGTTLVDLNFVYQYGIDTLSEIYADPPTATKTTVPAGPDGYLYPSLGCDLLLDRENGITDPAYEDNLPQRHMTDVFGCMLDDVRESYREFRRDMALGDAETAGLDEIGKRRDLQRLANESNDDFRQRILDEFENKQQDGTIAGIGFLEYFDPTTALPADPDDGDRYLSNGTGNGWLDGHYYEWNGSAWIDVSETKKGGIVGLCKLYGFDCTAVEGFTIDTVGEGLPPDWDTSGDEKTPFWAQIWLYLTPTDMTSWATAQEFFSRVWRRKRAGRRYVYKQIGDGTTEGQRTRCWDQGTWDEATWEEKEAFTNDFTFWGT